MRSRPITGEPALLLGALAAGAGVWLTGNLAARASCAVSGCQVRAGGVQAVLAMLIGTSPSQAWGAPGMNHAVFWVVAVVLAGVLVAGGAVAAVRVGGSRLRPAGGRGLASGQDVRRFYSGRALEKMTWLRPDLTSPRAADLGVPVGVTRWGKVWVTIEDSVAVSSPSRQGKTRYLIIPMILNWQGPAVITSVRAELATTTIEARRRLGPVAVFSPTTDVAGVVDGTQVLRWSLTSGCETPTVALRRARALTANAGKGTENSDFWQANAQSALATMLHAAALAGVGVDDLARWCASPGQARGAVAILKSRGSATAWGEQLDGLLAGDQRTVSNIWATLNSCVALPLMDPAVRRALSPTEEESLDIEAFLARSGTLYIVGDATASSAPIVAALIEEVYAVAQERANRSVGNRLTPPLAQILDELNNIAVLPSLPTMMSAGGGSGVMTVVVEQSRAQSAARWGEAVAGAIWDSATVKILLGGITRSETLGEVSDALGERVVSRVTTSRGKGPASTSLAEHKEPVLSRGQIHALTRGQALVIKAGAPAVVVKRLGAIRTDEASHGSFERLLMGLAERQYERRNRRAGQQEDEG